MPESGASDATHAPAPLSQNGFLLRLSDALRPLADPVEIQETVAHMVRQSFGADRCFYCELSGDRAIIRRDASREEFPSVAGAYPLGSLPLLKTALDAGQPLSVQDVRTSDLVDDELRQLCIDMQIISCLNVPAIRQGEPVGVFCLVQGSPRHWTEAEVQLAAETAERTWAAVDRGRAEGALRARGAAGVPAEAQRRPAATRRRH